MTDDRADITFKDFLNSIYYNFDKLIDAIYKKPLLEDDIKHIKELPNFDADIFKEITGIEIV